MCVNNLVKSFFEKSEKLLLFLDLRKMENIILEHGTSYKIVLYGSVDEIDATYYLQYAEAKIEEPDITKKYGDCPIAKPIEHAIYNNCFVTKKYIIFLSDVYKIKKHDWTK